MSLSKETVEAGGPAPRAGASVAQSKPDLSKLRADAVSLDVPVRVHGSRVTEVVRGLTSHTEPFEEEASTMIVFPHGGVVRMATTVGVGQMLVLTNLRTSQDAICRVVKVRAYSNSQAYVEVEFTHRQVGYWGVRFPADDEESFPTAAPPTSSPEQDKKSVVSSVTVRVEPLPKSPVAPARNESAFAPIGSQEEVQPPAAHTELRPRSVPSAPAARFSTAAPVGNGARPAMTKVSASASPMTPVEAEPNVSESNIEAEEHQAAATFGTLTGGTRRTGQAILSSDFGARLDAGISTPAQAVTASNNWMWIAACLFFLLAGLAGSAFYFRQHSAESQTGTHAPMALPQPVAPATAGPAMQSPEIQQETASERTEASVPVPTATNAEHQSRVATNAPEQPARVAENAPARELRPVPAAEPTSTPVSKNFAPTNARPVARAIERSRTTAAPSLTTAPAVSATPSGSEALPGVLNSSEAALPPPPQQALTRVRVGGVIVQPKLLHSVAPNYPSAARTAGISGNVVIVANVAKTGDVTSMKVISGPVTLQAAAMSALRSWKYQPATLDGSPIATDVTVTIKFQRQ
ncbi:MAG TPA: TonB family protein [Candidatus Acidoferrales bacterium]|nr:TonB family protein [Candidatus Acidoferrales bacterium]